MTGQGWITGSDIISKPPTKEYREGWERIFGKKVKDYTEDLEVGDLVRGAKGEIGQVTWTDNGHSAYKVLDGN